MRLCTADCSVYIWNISSCVRTLIMFNDELMSLASRTESIFRRTAGAWWRARRARGSRIRERCWARTADRPRWRSTAVWRRCRKTSDSCRTYVRTRRCSDETEIRQLVADTQFDDHDAPSDSGPTGARHTFSAAPQHCRSPNHIAWYCSVNQQACHMPRP